MYQKVIMMGRLAADPELRQTPSGVSVATFAIAVDRQYADKDGKRHADFFDIVAWRELGEFVTKYFCKGKPCLVDGRIETRTYTDKNGIKRKLYEVIAQSVRFCGDGSKTDKGLPEAPPAPKQTEQEDFTEMDPGDDLPF